MNNVLRKGRIGFTLIEMLVVVAILAVLISLTVRSVSRGILSAQQAQSMSNLRQLVMANLAYATEHQRFAPADDQWNTRRWHGARTSIDAPFDPTQGFLSDYLGMSRQVTQCPLFQEMNRGSQTFEEGTGGYGYNSSYIGGRPGGGYDSQGNRVSARPTQIANAQTIMFSTSAYATGNSVQEYAYTEPPFWDFGNGPVSHRPSPTTHFRFNRHALVGWVDGSVSRVKMAPRAAGTNPHGGNADAQSLGWFGPDEENGFWNPSRRNQ